MFLAWQQEPGGFEKKVALKQLLPHLASDARAEAALLDEARIGALLRHLNVAEIFEVGEGDGSYFIAMELVEGHSVRELIGAMRAGGRPIPLAVFLAIAEPMLSALAATHRLTDEGLKPVPPAWFASLQGTGVLTNMPGAPSLKTLREMAIKRAVAS